MFVFATKYFSIIICSLLLFGKINGIKSNYINIISSVAFSFLLTLLSFFVRSYFPALIAFELIISTSFYESFFCKIKFGKLLIFTTISLGISYATNIIAVLLFTPALYFILNDFLPLPYSTLNNLASLCIFIIQFILTNLLFKIKRFKKGISTIVLYSDTRIQLIISSSILILFTILLPTSTKLKPIDITIVAVTTLCAISFFVSWKYLLKKLYIEKNNIKKIEYLDKEIENLNCIVENLKANNDELASIIHSDNKLLPSTYTLVDSFIKEIPLTDLNDKTKAQDTLHHLEELYSRRNLFILNYEQKNKPLPKTSILSLDTSLEYMRQKSNSKNIQFDANTTSSFASILELVKDEDINTILLDLLDNAIISISSSSDNFILVNLFHSTCYSLEVLDSGSPFEPTVIQKMGKSKVTSHKRSGGSGIGLMSTFNILSNYNASFYLEEYENPKKYTKKITIIFDSLNQIKIISPRSSSLKDSINRSDIIFIDS